MIDISLVIYLLTTEILPFSNDSKSESESESLDSSDSGRAELEPNRKKRRERSDTIIPNTADPSILANFAPEFEDRFYHGGGDLGAAYWEAGMTDAFENMRLALEGEKEALAKVFGYGGMDTEAYGSLINMMIEELGDRWFAMVLREQTPEVQEKIVRCIWDVEWYRGTKLVPNSDGEMPPAESGSYYPATADILLEVQARLLE